MATDGRRSISIDLGQADVRCIELDINVQLRGAMQLATADDVEQLRQALGVARLPDDGAARPWIRQGSCLRLDVTVHFGECIGAPDDQEIVRTLSKNIEAARMWQQLNLKPRTIQSSYNEPTDSWHVAIRLARDVEGCSYEQRLHGLGKDIPFHDARPPKGIVEASCERITIGMLLSRSSGLKRNRPEADETLEHYTNLSHQHEAEPLIADDDCEQDVFPTPNHVVCDQHDHDALFEDLDLYTEREKHDEQRSCDENLYQARGDAGQVSNALLKRKLSETSATPSSVVDCELYVRLIEVALQMVIAGPAQLNKASMFTCRSSSIQPLANAVPSIWSPGYLQQVTERALLIPTTAHALASVLTSSTKPSRGDTVVDTNDGIVYAHHESASNIGRLSEPMQAAIWSKAQACLHRRTAARRLEPLSDLANHYAIGASGSRSPLVYESASPDEPELTLEVDCALAVNAIDEDWDDAAPETERPNTWRLSAGQELAWSDDELYNSECDLDLTSAVTDTVDTVYLEATG